MKRITNVLKDEQLISQDDWEEMIFKGIIITLSLMFSLVFLYTFTFEKNNISVKYNIQLGGNHSFNTERSWVNELPPFDSSRSSKAQTKAIPLPWRVRFFSKVIAVIFWWCDIGSTRIFNRASFETLNPKIPSTYPHFHEGVRTMDVTIVPEKFCKKDMKQNCDQYNSNHETLIQQTNIKFRLFEPESLQTQQEKRPMLIWIHGGGFNLGHPDDSEQDFIARQFAKQGNMMVLSIDYRLAPEHPYPAPVHDMMHLLSWLNNGPNRKVWMDTPTHGPLPATIPWDKIDLKRLLVGGDSAGGNLAAVTASYLRDHPADNLKIIYQILACPTFALIDTPSKRRFQNGHVIPESIQRYFFTNYAAGNFSILFDPYVNPLYSPNGLKNLPPAYLVVAGQDPLQDDAYLYLNQLKHDGQHGVIARYESMMHGFFTMSFFPESHIAMRHLMSYLHSERVL